MSKLVSLDRVRFFFARLRERLWIKPLALCVISIAAAFFARLADDTELSRYAPSISSESIESLLSIMAASMLVIATFAVSSMVSAYASASTTATPRTFALVIADDVSQNALSTFIGSFIFSIVALTALKNDYYGIAGRFALMSLTATVFGIVIVTFVRWVDRIARLGRLGATIDKVEQATTEAFKRRKATPALNGVPMEDEPPKGHPVYAKEVNYVQHIDVAALQKWAEEHEQRIWVDALPGTFVTPGRPLAYIESALNSEDDHKAIVDSFVLGGDRMFSDDPRFGLIVLSEIAGRALSPAVNDPGTAIDIIGTLIRLFVVWGEESEDLEAVKYDRVAVPTLSVRDMFDDAFTAIARDGAGTIEVSVRLQKALESLAAVGNPAITDAALYHSKLALARAERALSLPEELAELRGAALCLRPA